MRNSLILSLILLLIYASGCSRSRDVERPPEDNRSRLTTTPIHAAKLPASHDQNGRFELLNSEKTGIDFVHRWDPTPRHELKLANAVAGGGVAVGDYDGDGRPDIYLTRPAGGNRLYRNLGAFQFQDMTDAAGIRNDKYWGTGACFVDVDNDGWLDLYVCGYDCANQLYINQGDGTFAECAATCGVDFCGASIMAAWSDYDADGDLDMYLLTNRLDPVKEFQTKAFRRDGKWHVPEEVRELNDVLVKPDGTPFPIDAGQFDHLYRNDGPGPDGRNRFVEVTDEAGMRGNHFGLSATWWDVDGDGFPDLYVANDFYGPDQLYHNNGDGTFTDVTQLALPHTPWFSMGADYSDINNDGHLDFMATDMSGTSHYKQKVAMGEMGENAWFLGHAEPRQYMRNALYLNTGTGRFWEVAYLTGLADSNWTWSIRFADLDSDGREDLFVANGMTRDWFNSDLRAQARRLGEWQQGSRDLWLNEPPLRERNLAFRNHGNLTFKDTSHRWGLDEMSVSFGATVADLDGDGHLDIVVNNFESAASIYRNQLQTGHRIAIRLRGSPSNRFGLGASVRLSSNSGQQIRYLSSSRGFMAASEPAVHFGLGEETMVDQLSVTWPSGTVQEFSQLPVDRLYTITEPDSRPPERTVPRRPPPMFRRDRGFPTVVHREFPNDDFAQQPLLPHKLSQLGPGLAWGDIDGDANDDLFVGGAAGHAGRILMNNSGVFASLKPSAEHPTSVPATFETDRDFEDMGVLFFDADGDEDLDLYVVSGSSQFAAASPLLRDRLYLNDGRGTFRSAPEGTLPSESESGGTVAAADFDRDGDLDLFVGGRQIPGKYPLSPRSVVLRNETSPTGMNRFVDVTREIAPGLERAGMVTGAIWSDTNGNGWLDLLLTCDWGTVQLWRNNQGRLTNGTNSAGLAGKSGWWNGIAGRDLDNDGDIDYVVTNVGQNTKYHASTSHPLVMYYGDFDNSGRLRLVEAEYEGNRLLPMRGKSCSSRAIPILSDRFGSFHEFALASLDDIYTAERLDNAHRFEANTLDTSVLLNQGDGSFDVRPLPRLAQISPSYGVVLTDFNGDGNTDIYLAQNFFSTQIETGRMDGGTSLLLTGAGDGTFSARFPSESGLVVAGDAKGLTAADINSDHRMDLIVAMNGGPLLAFLNECSTPSQFFSVRLKGSKGNRQAIGARVTVNLSNGSKQTAEVHAGSGYLSQSSTEQSFGLGPDNQVDRVDIRWPDGSLSEHRVPRDRTSILIERP